MRRGEKARGVRRRIEKRKEDERRRENRIVQKRREESRRVGERRRGVERRSGEKVTLYTLAKEPFPTVSRTLKSLNDIFGREFPCADRGHLPNEELRM